MSHSERFHELERLGLLGEGHELGSVGLGRLDAVEERAILQVTAVFIVKGEKVVLVVLAADIPLCNDDAAQVGSQLVGHGQ